MANGAGIALAQAFVEIRGTSDKLSDDIKDGTGKAIDKAKGGTEEHGKRLGGHLGSGMKTAVSGFGPILAGFGGAAAALGVAAIGGSLVGLVKDAQASAAAGRITAQVIKSTGGVAHVSASDIDDLTTAISNKTGVDDDAIRSGTNMLLTFTDVRNEVGKGNDVFNQATSMITDMSVALGQDAKNSAIQLGKALNDPIKGVSALSKVGVSFTDQQKKQIATLVKSGDTLGAQKVILKELGREFGGAAAAASDPMKKLETTLGNTAKGLATMLLPALNTAATWLNNVGLPAFQVFIGWLQANVLPVLGRIAAWIGSTGLPMFQQFIGWLSANVVPVFQTIAGFVVGTLIPAVMGLAHGFMTNVLPAIKTVVGIVATNLQPIIGALADFWINTLLPGIQDLIPIVQKVATWLGIVAGAIAVVVSWIVGKLAPILLNIIGGAIRLFIAALGKVVGAVGWVVDAVKGIWTWVSDTFGKVIGFVQGLPAKIASAASGMWDGIKNAFRSAINWLIDAWNGLHFKTPDVPGTDWGGQDLSVPQIPRLAGGGIVPARRGGTMAVLAEGGEDEIVTSRSKMREFMGGGMGGSLTVNIDARGATSEAAESFRQSAREIVYGIVAEIAHS